MRKQALLPVVIIAVTFGSVAYFGFGNSEKAVVELAGKCVSTVQQMWSWFAGMFRLT